MTTVSTEKKARSPDHPPIEAYPAQDARQGEIILKTKLSRVIFLTGLFGGFALLAIVVIVLATAG